MKPAGVYYSGLSCKGVRMRGRRPRENVTAKRIAATQWRFYCCLMCTRTGGRIETPICLRLKTPPKRVLITQKNDKGGDAMDRFVLREALRLWWRTPTMLRRLAAVVTLTAGFVGPAAVSAADVADFYRGKSVTIVVGFPPGGGYDLYARTLSRHLGQHIPGRPSVVVQNMPGAASMTATNYLYNLAPRDGSTVGAFDRNMPFVAILGGNANVRFKPEHFTWLGSLSNTSDDAFVLWGRKTSPAASLEQLRADSGPVLTVGATAAGATDNDIGVLLRDALKLRLKIVAGYPSTSAIALAVERGELDGQLMGFVSTKLVKPEWTSPNSDMRVLLQFARTTRLAEADDAPTARELARNETELRLIEAAEFPYRLARPFAAPPGIPTDKARGLQAAFRDASQDQAFLAEAQKMKLEISPVFAEEAMQLIQQLAQTPAAVLAQLRELR